MDLRGVYFIFFLVVASGAVMDERGVFSSFHLQSFGGQTRALFAGLMEVDRLLY